jgi:DNA-binding PadR family transcriptional regulator
MVRYAILGLLRGGAVRHGYALLKEYRQFSGCRLSVGNIYRELQRLLADGLVETAANPPGADPRRSPYRITAAGVAGFDEWLGSPRIGSVADYHDEMSLRACLVVRVKDAPVGQVLDRWREELSIRRSAFLRERGATAQNGGLFDPVALLTGRHLKHLSVDVEFVEELRAAYRAWAADSKTRELRQRPPVSASRRRAAR